MTRKEKKRGLEEQIAKEAEDLVIYILEYFEGLIGGEGVSGEFAWGEALKEAESKMCRQIKAHPQRKDVIMRVGRKAAEILDKAIREGLD